MKQETKSALRAVERKHSKVESHTQDVYTFTKQAFGYMHIPLPEGFPLPSGDVMTSLNEQLLHALQALHGREVELAEVRGVMEGLQRKFVVIMHQLGTLYQEYMERRSEWESHRSVLEAEKKKLFGEKEQDQIKVKELEVCRNYA